MKKRTDTTIYRKIIILGLVLIFLIFLNIFMILMANNQSQAISVLIGEKKLLENDRLIAEAAVELSEQYENEIDVFNEVFPTEETIPDFIQLLESYIREETTQYSFKFTSLTPIPEQDKLYLLLTLTMSADIGQVLSFLEKLETMPYMTHVLSVIFNSPTGMTAAGDVRIALKLYVQNPFTAK
ncbi:hypothetical protein A2154_02925 [Candidatus Gottesmanbacteria bacterium RBG_16_43_7]|uniref:Tfp pilus assembly protein PilO n=1 Tax=Candidatus Gottesmanbacteria bacterium RBG_16_43_7 TaxID=1798373 RepID=A0A1F5Z9W8_9BACT|nr:MAG: hypothetical protein A2154_02925 [Candidatus Gottesmanbacteria bacterium RBG_16_43_7]